MSETGKPATESRALRNLIRSIGRRCNGKTLILGRDVPALTEGLVSRGLEVLAADLDLAEASGGTFDSVVLCGALEYEDSEASVAVLRRAWGRVNPRGKLLVCVPNEDYDPDPDRRQSFTRRGLKQLLKSIDQPKIFTDQPLRWLLMAIEADSRLDRATNDRHGVISRLCRGRVLELGCAAGHLCARIAERGLGVAGIDKNADKIAKATRLFPKIPFEQADILSLPEDERYDTVVLAEVLEHVNERVGARMLEKAWALVGPRGRLIVSVPNEDCVRHANHLREFTRNDLALLLEPFGFPVIVADQPFKWLMAYVDRPAFPLESSSSSVGCSS